MFLLLLYHNILAGTRERKKKMKKSKLVAKINMELDINDVVFTHIKGTQLDLITLISKLAEELKNNFSKETLHKAIDFGYDHESNNF